MPKPKITIIFLLTVSAFVFSPKTSQGATRLLYEPFTNVTYLDAGGGDSVFQWCGGAARCPWSGITTNSPSPGSGGKSFLSYITSYDPPACGEADYHTGTALGYAGNWGISEFYFSMYQYIHTDITDGELESIKLFIVNDVNDPFVVQNNSNWFILNYYGDGGFHLYGVDAPESYSQGSYLGGGGGFQQGSWLKISAYVKYNTNGQYNGIFKASLNDQLVCDYNDVKYFNSNRVVRAVSSAWHYKTFGSQVGNIAGFVQVDDIEFWDGMPSGQPDTQAPTVPTSLTATAISSSQINLSWTVSTDNVGVTGYRIYRCQRAGCTPSTQIGTSATNSYSDTGLSPSTTYTYTVSAYDAAGNVSGQSTSATATTQAPPDTTPPAAPTGVKVE